MSSHERKKTRARLTGRYGSGERETICLSKCRDRFGPICRCLGGCHESAVRYGTSTRMLDVLDLGEEPDFRGVHWVFFGEEQFELEYSAWLSVSARVFQHAPKEYDGLKNREEMRKHKTYLHMGMIRVRLLSHQSDGGCRCSGRR